MRRALLLVIVLAGRAPAAEIDVGVPAPVGAGARALGLGGAFTAVADDATAHTWNPAGLVQLEHPEVSASFGWYRRDSQARGSTGTERDALDLDHVAVALPFFALGAQQAVGLSWQRQFDFTALRQVDSVQSDAIATAISDSRAELSGAIASLGAAYAIEPVNGLGLGLAVDLWDHRLTGRGEFSRQTDESSRVFDVFGLSDVTNITRTHDRFVVEEGYSFAAGAWWQPRPWLNLGLTAKPEYRLRVSIDSFQRGVTIDNFNGGVTTGQSSASDRATWYQPASYTVATAIRAGDVWTCAVDATWTEWSRYRSESRIGTRSPIASQHDPGDFPDCWTLRLGIERLVLLERAVLALRVGGFYQQMPGIEKAADTTPAAVAAAHAQTEDWTGLACGGSVFIRAVSIDAALEWRHADGIGAGREAAADADADVDRWTGRLGFTWHL